MPLRLFKTKSGSATVFLQVARRLTVLITICGAGLPLHASDQAKRNFESRCAVCHVNDGSSRTNRFKERVVGADLRSEEVQKLSDAQLFDSIAYGTGHKEYPHAFFYRHVTADEIRELVSYIRTFKRK